MGLFVARDRDATVISRSAIRVPDGRRVRRGWSALVEIRAPQHPTHADRTPAVVGLIALPPLLVALPAIHYMGVEAAVVAAGLTLLVMLSVVPALFRRHLAGPRRPLTALPPRRSSRAPFLTARRPAPASQADTARRPGSPPPDDGARWPGLPSSADGVRTLTAVPERGAFDRAVSTADRISETWPALDGLIDIPEAESLLAGALWEISGLLARRQELTAVLAGLTRPDFAALSPSDDLAERLGSQIRATKEALSEVEIALAAREASLRRTEEAGRTFIRERELREAIRAAERSLGTRPDPSLPAFPIRDSAAELAEHTGLVIAAYRELTTTLHPDELPPSSAR